MRLGSMTLCPTVGDVLTSALLSSQPPLSLWQGVKSPSPANVSECSVIQGRFAAVDKYWKCYPSLKHHSFTYWKCASLWAPSPHCWQRGRQHQADPAMTAYHQTQPQTQFSLLKLQRRDCVSEIGLMFVKKNEPVFHIIPGVRNNLQKALLWDGVH